MIDTDELQQELDKTQNAFRKWAAATSRVAQECKNAHLRNIRVASGAGRGWGAGGALQRRVRVLRCGARAALIQALSSLLCPPPLK